MQKNLRMYSFQMLLYRFYQWGFFRKYIWMLLPVPSERLNKESRHTLNYLSGNSALASDFQITNQNYLSDVVLVSYCWLWAYFTPFSGAAVIDFEQVNVSWV